MRDVVVLRPSVGLVPLRPGVDRGFPLAAHHTHRASAPAPADREVAGASRMKTATSSWAWPGGRDGQARDIRAGRQDGGRVQGGCIGEGHVAGSQEVALVFAHIWL